MRFSGFCFANPARRGNGGLRQAGLALMPARANLAHARAILSLT
jgi:hypothetical protein